MLTQRPLTSSVRQVSKNAKEISTKRTPYRSASLTRESNRNNQTSNYSRINQKHQPTTKSTRPSIFTEKQIAARREKEQQNIDKWQAYNKYYNQVNARLELFENWNKKELNRSKSVGCNLNQIENLNYSFNNLNTSFNYLETNRIDELLIDNLENKLYNQLINELYIIDPRKIPYDVDCELLRKPEAIKKLKIKINKEEIKLKKLKDAFNKIENELNCKLRLKNKLLEHKNQLEQIYLEYSKKWLIDWERRLNRLELKCCDEELLFPARRGQIKAKDRLRLRNNLISEHFNKCRHLFIQLRKLSGCYKVYSDCIDRKSINCSEEKIIVEIRNDVKFDLDSNNMKIDLKKTNFFQQKNEEYNENIHKDYRLIQLLNDDEIEIVSKLLFTTINMLDIFIDKIKNRSNLYSALYDEEAKSVWHNETVDLKDKIKICVTLMNKIFYFHVTIYNDKIDLLNKQINNLNLKLENRKKHFYNALDYLKQDQSNFLTFNLINKSLLKLNN